MKKSLLILSLAFALFSCNKEAGTPATGAKTAYVDTEKLSKEYDAFKDLETKSKVKEQEMGRELEAAAQKLRLDYAAAQNESQAKGPQWSQLKAQELQKREQEIGMMQQAMAKQLQDEFGAKNDSAVSQMKKHIKEYGKKNGYDYIYSTAGVSSIMYAKESYDLTDKILKELNEEYKSSGKKDEAAKETPVKEEKK
jgi:outer membrane protein